MVSHRSNLCMTSRNSRLRALSQQSYSYLDNSNSSAGHGGGKTYGTFFDDPFLAGLILHQILLVNEYEVNIS